MTEDARGPREERDASLDRLLDLALRRMAGGEGPADMRRRVLARLDERPHRVEGRRAMVLTAAAVIVVALALATVRLRHERSAPALTSERRPPLTLPISPSPPASGSRPPAPIARLAASSGRPAVRPRPPAPLAGQEPDEVGADAGGMEPIEVAPLAIVPMETPRWVIAELQIPPIQIEPLADSPPGEP